MNGRDIKGATMPECKWEGGIGVGGVHVNGKCVPEGRCETAGFGGMKCVAKPWWDSPQNGGWWPVDDRKLVDVVAPAMTTGHGLAVSDFFGLEMSLHCAPKKDFGSSGPPKLPQSPPTLLQCLKEGVETNARLKSKEPWRLYFPDEVVVVATFQAIEERACMLSKAGMKSEDKEKLQAELCGQSGADARGELLGHLFDARGQPHQKAGESDRYMGATTGVGWPTGALEEAFISPEDVLEALESPELITP